MRIDIPLGCRVSVLMMSAVVLAQCSRSDLGTATSPDAVASPTMKVVGDATTSAPAFGQLKICKTGNTGGTFTVSATPVTGGSPTVLSPITVAAGQCRVAAEEFSPGGAGANITVTETSAGLVSISAQRIDLVAGSPVTSAATFSNGGTVFINGVHGWAITFTNNFEVPPPPPLPGDEGCTPGFWKQPQHLDSWTAPFDPTDDFDSTFGVNFFSPNITLEAALGLGGGGTNALARHAVAALLNAASADVEYQYTTAEVLAIVQGTGTFAGLSIEARKDLLAAANEAGCPLN